MKWSNISLQSALVLKQFLVLKTEASFNKDDSSDTHTLIKTAPNITNVSKKPVSPELVLTYSVICVTVVHFKQLMTSNAGQGPAVSDAPDL